MRRKLAARPALCESDRNKPAETTLPLAPGFGPITMLGGMTSEPVLRKIRAAFANLPRSRMTMADAEVIDDQDESSRFEENDHQWWEIPDALLDRCSAPFTLLSTVDFIYYLPAYMSWVIRTDGVSEYVSPEFLIYYLEDPERGGSMLKLLNPQQTDAVITFLQWVVGNTKMAWIKDHATTALNSIWKRPAELSAAPNGGPATQLANSGATEGPPSVSSLGHRTRHE